MKAIVFRFLQPATVVLVVLFWAWAPAALLDKAWAITAASVATVALVQALEFVNERHASWRQNRREFLTDLFYVALYYGVISTVVTKLNDDPLTSAKHALGITTDWAMHLPFVAQVALVLFVIEFGQYWMHRLMHNSFVWWTHAPHHHITQLNAAKGLVVYYRRPGGQSQFSTLLDVTGTESRFGPTLTWAREHLGERLSVERLAAKAALSVRQFSRAFSLDVGMSPAKAIESLRVEAARSQIETGSSQLEAIARRIGFGSVDRMRHAFVRAYGQTPQELRRIARNER